MSCTDEALGSYPISVANPTGVNPREGAAFVLAQTELEKLTNIHADSGVEWTKVAEACAKVLREEGKDFNAAIWLICAWTQTRDLPGLVTGVHVFRELLEHFWETMTPPPSRLRARRNQAEWMLEWLEARLDDSFTPLPGAQLESLLQDWDAIDNFWREQDSEGPAFFRFRRRLAQLPVQVSVEPQPVAVAAQPEVVAAEDVQATPVPVITAPQLAAQPQVAASIQLPALEAVQSLGNLEREDAIESAITGVLGSLSPLVDFCLESRPTLPLLYRLTRQMAWTTLEQAPFSQGNTTRLPPPPASEVDSLARLQGLGEPLDIVRFCERRLAAYPFWLDLNRVSYAALGRLGPDAASAAASLAGETRHLLARIPLLAELTFANGQPFADGATRSWVEGLAPATSGGTTDAIQALIDEARQGAADGQLKDAISRLQSCLREAGNGRDRFRLRKAQYELLQRFDPSPQLSVALDVLLQDARAQQLAHWEPDLVQPLLEHALGYTEGGSKTLWAEQLAAMDLSAYWHLSNPQAG